MHTAHKFIIIQYQRSACDTALGDLVFVRIEKRLRGELLRRLVVHRQHGADANVCVGHLGREGDLHGEEVTRNRGGHAELDGPGLVGRIDDGMVPLQQVFTRLVLVVTVAGGHRRMRVEAARVEVRPSRFSELGWSTFSFEATITTYGNGIEMQTSCSSSFLCSSSYSMFTSQPPSPFSDGQQLTVDIRCVLN